ncbi:hypothetical protein [Rhodopila sp.]|uniref:hypothetical protein n=1 Tax=Rhodopila sp. TaxID=2480087 RepID=UPI003D143ED2
MATNFLKDFIIRAGAALEAEDRLIMGSGHVRGESGGILRLNNERVYQFILWRAVLSSWNAKVEERTHDLVIFDPTDPSKHLAIFEMKKWMAARGLPELPGILTDIKRLNASDAPNTALIIFSANDRGDMDKQLTWLEERIFAGIPKPPNATYCFLLSNSESIHTYC